MSAMLDNPDLAPPAGVRMNTADDADDTSANDDLYVSFQLGDEMFAVQMAPVQEIIRVPSVSRLPLAPPSLDGLANLRGRVLPIVNLRRIFGAPERELDDASRAVVIQLGQPLGFVVDRVASVVRAGPDEIETAEAIQSTVKTDYLTGVIRRPMPDGSHELLMTIDFQRLIEREFNAADAIGGTDTAARATRLPGDTPAEGRESRQSEELRLVSFTVAGQEYAIHIEEVQEIVQLPDSISAVPNAPSHVLGLISLRERLLPLVSLRRLFCLPDLAHEE
jgi:purine-binding chemotaxis protein CheW